MPHDPDWIMLTFAFVLGLFVGVGSMYAFRNYEVRQVLRLKGELVAERKLMWEEIRR